MLISRTFVTGATGLEPATSGVTGRYGSTGYNRLRPGITRYSRHFVNERTGCDRLRPATTRQALCSRAVDERGNRGGGPRVRDRQLGRAPVVPHLGRETQQTRF